MLRRNENPYNLTPPIYPQAFIPKQSDNLFPILPSARFGAECTTRKLQLKSNVVSGHLEELVADGAQ